MFGYLRVDRCRIDPAATGLYRAHFCAGCHALARAGGRTASLLTSYDQTLLVLVLSGLEARARGDVNPRVLRARCTALPLHRVAVAELSTRGREFIAAATVALVDGKLRDDAVDEGRLLPRLGRRLLATRTRRAHELLGREGVAPSAFMGLTARQLAAESCPDASLGELTAPTCDLLGEIFAGLARLTRVSTSTADLVSFGRALGGAIYGLDALQDRERDLRDGQFNAVARVGVEAMGEFLGQELETLHQSLSSLSLGSCGVVVSAIVQSLDRRIKAGIDALGGGPRLVEDPAFAGQRGDCDCCCACTECAECGACGSESGVCAGCCDSACCLGDCCDCLCCFGSRSRKGSSKKKQRTDSADRGDQGQLL